MLAEVNVLSMEKNRRGVQRRSSCVLWLQVRWGRVRNARPRYV